MDEAERLIRERLEQAEKRLAQIESERVLWLAIREGDQRLLTQLSGQSPTLPMQKIGATGTVINPGMIVSRKWTGAIREILQGAAGATVTTQQIYELAKAAGLTTKSSDPLAIIDWNISKMIRDKTAPIERVRTQHYRWAA